MKVFLVEDSEIILAYLRRMVAEVPGAVVQGEASRQDDAVAGIVATTPDVVILDLALAQGNGIEVLRRVRPLQPDVTIIILTNKCAAQYRSRCLALGADHVLDKSHDMEILPRHLAALGMG
jgi:DNA-binding NarL/FixJ family response regulator